MFNGVGLGWFSALLDHGMARAIFKMALAAFDGSSRCLVSMCVLREKGTPPKVSRSFTRKFRSGSSLNCRMCAMFAR